MKSSELRIGNFVSDFHASESYYSEVIELKKNRCYYGNFHSVYSDLKPILLTEEWLLKFGFSLETKIGGDGIKFRVYHFDVLTFNTNHGWWYSVIHLRETTLDYVHQLQNFYFALTGKELTLKSEQ